MSSLPSSLRILLRCGLLAVLFGASARVSLAADASNSVEKQLLIEAPKIIKELKQKGYQNVGVLKFRIEKGGQPVDRVGTLNGNLADRVELALILANNARAPLGVIHDASKVAAGIFGADHRTPEGRQKLFAAQYPLAWGTQEVTPDALLIGTVKMASGGDMSVSIFSLDATSAKPFKLSQFEVPPTVSNLTEAGESFVLRGVFDSGSVQLAAAGRDEKAREEVQENVQQVVERPQDHHPLSPRNTAAPVALQVLYDGVVKPLEFRDGQAQIPEPAQGQKVTLVLTRKATDSHTYAIVLKVNGENTIARQRLNDLQCSKWVLAPKTPLIKLRGFQLENDKAEAFRVASPHESAARAIDYGRDVGTISLVVFRDVSNDRPSDPKPQTDAEDDLAILMRGVLPEKADDFGTLRSKLISSLANGDAVRGIIMEGNQIEQKTTAVTFQADPIPVMSGVITYYQAR